MYCMGTESEAGGNNVKLFAVGVVAVVGKKTSFPNHEGLLTSATHPGTWNSKFSRCLTVSP